MECHLLWTLRVTYFGSYFLRISVCQTHGIGENKGVTKFECGNFFDSSSLRNLKTEIIDSLEPFTNFDDFDAEDEQLKIKANGRKKVIRTCFTL